MNTDPHSAIALAKHAPRSGARVLDVGCGVGETTRDLGRLVGTKGRVVGLDCCEGFLEVARTEARAAGSSAENVSFVAGDAQTHPFDGSFDLVFARFGTMFLQSPTAGHRNMRTALRPGGRLLEITWRALALNAWAAIPKEIVLRHLPPPPEEGRVCGPGPFSMADADVVRAILEGAGYSDVRLEAVDSPMVVGRDLDEAVDFQLDVGPAGEIVREAADLFVARRAAVVADLREALAAYQTPRGIVMGSSSWTVTATNPTRTS